jgi:hypothetical protein
MSKEQIQEELKRAREAEKYLDLFLNLPTLQAIKEQYPDESSDAYRNCENASQSLSVLIESIEEMEKKLNIPLEEMSTESLEQEIERRKRKEVSLKRPRTNESPESEK